MAWKRPSTDPCMVCGTWICNNDPRCDGRRHRANPLTADKQGCPRCHGLSFQWLPTYHYSYMGHDQREIPPEDWSLFVDATKRLLHLE